MQECNRALGNSQNNSDEDAADIAGECDIGSNVSAVEDDSLLHSESQDDMESKSETSAPLTSTQGKPRKRVHDKVGKSLQSTKEIQDIGKLVNTSTKVMQQIVARRESVNDRAKQHDLNEDKDWIFAKLIYNKMKDIPEGVDKDDLQIEIQKLINDARKKNQNRCTANTYTCCTQYLSDSSMGSQSTQLQQQFQQQPMNYYQPYGHCQQQSNVYGSGAAVASYCSPMSVPSSTSVPGDSNLEPCKEGPVYQSI